MSNQTKFTSLIQLITYTGFKDFLTQYHNEVKEETGQYLGISKALKIASNVIQGYKNHHEFTHCLKKVEENHKIFTTRKNVIIVSTIDNIGDGDFDVSNETFSSWEKATDDLKSDFHSLAIREDLNSQTLLDLFSSYYDDEDVENFESDLDFIQDIENNNSIDIYDIARAIEEICCDEKKISIKEKFVDFDITVGDIHEAIFKNDFETGKN